MFLIISLLGSFYASVSAQTCPSGWTSVANGTTYPMSASGTVTAGDLNNIVFGGVDGNVLRADAGVVLDFGQSLASGGTVSIVASGINTTSAGNFNVNFSTDGITYSASVLVTVPKTTTLATYTITASQSFRYMRLASASSSYTNYDAVSYQGSFCQAPTVSYASCGSGESQAVRFVEPIAVAGTAGLTPDNVAHGPDGYDVDLTTSAQSIIAMYAKAFASGDTILVTGYKYSSSAGDFQVLTSLDGANFTALPAVAFSDVSPNFQTVKIVATQPFQYIKLVRSGSGQVTVDAVRVFGKVCVTNPSACSAGATFVSNGLTYPVEAIGTAYTGDIDNMVVGGADGNVVRVNDKILLDFGQTLAAGGMLSFVASTVNINYTGYFDVKFSTDAITYSDAIHMYVHADPTMSLQTYNLIVPQSFRYIQLANPLNGNGNYTFYDAVSYQGDFCQTPIVSYANCGSGESQTWQLVEPSAVAGTVGLTPDNAMHSSDGLTVSLINDTQSIVGKYDKAFASGDTIEVIGYKYTSTQVGDFQVLTSLDGIHFTALSAVTFTNRSPNFQTVKIVATQPFQYIKLVRSGSGQVTVDAINVFGKTCITCNVTATPNISPVTCATVGGTNANGAIILTTFGGGATKVGYSVGSSYTGPAFASATTLTTAPFTITNTLANPNGIQPYTIRVFGSTCYKDYVVTLNPTLCLTADLSLSVSPTTQLANKGEQLTYTFTLTNAGPDAAPNVIVSVPIPGNTAFLSATPAQGTYSGSTSIWDVGTMPVGSKTLSLTVQIK